MSCSVADTVRLSGKKFVCVLCLLVLLSSCVSTTKIEILHPATVTLPPYVGNIGIVNRVIPRDNNMTNQGQCAFGDLFSFNLQTSDSCISSVFYFLRNSPRFKDVDIRDEMVRDGTDYFPLPMDSAFIREACAKYGVDALAVLEAFISHSDLATQMSSNRIPYTVNYLGANGVRYNRTEYRIEYYYRATLHLYYSAGFRLYGADGSILDETRVEKNVDHYGSGGTENAAINNLPSRISIINAIAAHVGDVYAHRISPMWAQEKRHLYALPDKNMKEAYNSIYAHQWPDAEKRWKDIYRTTKGTKQGIAAFNLAVIFEAEGDIFSALDMVQKAKVIFTNRKKKNHSQAATDYITLLNNRVSEMNKLMHQMER